MSSSPNELSFKYTEVSALFNNVDIAESSTLEDKRVNAKAYFPFLISPNISRSRDYLSFTVKDIRGADKKLSTFVHSIKIYIGDYYLKDREYLYSSIGSKYLYSLELKPRQTAHNAFTSSHLEWNTNHCLKRSMKSAGVISSSSDKLRYVLVKVTLLSNNKGTSEGFTLRDVPVEAVKLMNCEVFTLESQPVSACYSLAVAGTFASDDIRLKLYSQVESMKECEDQIMHIHGLIKLTCEDGEIFFAHRNVMMAVSDVFTRILTSDMKEKRDGEIKVNASGDIMRVILKFVYLGDTHWMNEASADDLDYIREVLRVCHLYDLHNLVTHVTNRLLKLLEANQEVKSPKILADLIEIAFIYDLESLKHYSIAVASKVTLEHTAKTPRLLDIAVKYNIFQSGSEDN